MGATIYGLVDPFTGDLRYIGKANCATRRLKSHWRDARRRTTPVALWLQKLCRAGATPILLELEATDDWVASERAWISDARAHCPGLLNIAAGGNEPGKPPVANAYARSRRGEELNRHMANDPVACRVRDIKRRVARALREGIVLDETKALMRQVAIKDPAHFGDWLVT